MKTEVEYIDDTHQYLINGVLVPSVSELIKFKYPDMYSNVPKTVLRQSANYGTKVHDYIQRFVEGEFTIEELKERNIDPNIKIAVEQFEYLRKMWAFQIKDMEQIVHYKEKYAGRYDMRTIEGDDLILDLKTTSEIHEEWLSWQLGLYYMAAGLKRDFGYVIWLPKGKAGQVKQINVKSHEECRQLLEDYEKAEASKQ